MEHGAWSEECNGETGKRRVGPGAKPKGMFEEFMIEAFFTFAFIL